MFMIINRIQSCSSYNFRATLESLCNNLYDVFRPLIIHINHLETLAELCSILKVEMIEEHVYNNRKLCVGIFNEFRPQGQFKA